MSHLHPTPEHFVERDDTEGLPDLAKVEAEEQSRADAAKHDAEAAAKAFVEWETRDRELRRALDDVRSSLCAEVALLVEGHDRLHMVKRVSAKERAALAAWLENSPPGAA